MGKRLELQTILESVLGSANVYFQPPSNIEMGYPCIVYGRSQNGNSTIYANNQLYRNKQSYTVTVIDPNPDSEINLKIMSLPYIRWDRHFTSNNLNHDIYTIFY